METVRFALDADNAFSGELALDEPRFVYLRMPRRTILLYLQPGAISMFTLMPPIQTCCRRSQEKKPWKASSWWPTQWRLTGIMAGTSSWKALPACKPKTLSAIWTMFTERKWPFLSPLTGTTAGCRVCGLIKANFLYEKYGLLMDYPRYYAYFNQLEDGPELT
jgi:hypothetical protein